MTADISAALPALWRSEKPQHRDHRGGTEFTEKKGTVSFPSKRGNALCALCERLCALCVEFDPVRRYSRGVGGFKTVPGGMPLRSMWRR